MMTTAEGITDRHRLEDEKLLPSITIIIPVYNAEDTLDLCLKSISELEYPENKIEVLVVDNGSTDSSVIIAKQYVNQVLSESLIRSSYAARNKGIMAAHGDAIAFTDADCIVTSSWLRILMKEWSDKTIGCFAGEIKAYKPKSVVEIFSEREQLLEQAGTLKCPYLPYAQTANAIYRKEIFKQVGLFKPDMISGGDADIAWRMQRELGLGIKFDGDAIVYHRHRNSILGLYRQFKRYEHGKVLWSKDYPDYHLPSFEQRRQEFRDAAKEAFSRLFIDFKNYVENDIDFVTLATPFLKVVMSYGAYRARRLSL